jgi:hypothetical protein
MAIRNRLPLLLGKLRPWIFRRERLAVMAACRSLHEQIKGEAGTMIAYGMRGPSLGILIPRGHDPSFVIPEIWMGFAVFIVWLEIGPRDN